MTDPYMKRMDQLNFFEFLGFYEMKPIDTMYFFVRLDIEEYIEKDRWR